MFQHTAQKTNRPALTLDVARYQNMLDDPGLSETDKHDLLETLWLLVVSFIEVGIPVAPDAPANTFCGKLKASAPSAPQVAQSVLHSVQSNQTKAFDAAASASVAPKEVS